MAASHDPTILPPAIAATLRDHRVTRSLRRRPRVLLPVLQQLHNARVCHVFWVQSLVLRRV